jgi:hypothetical protein
MNSLTDHFSRFSLHIRLGFRQAGHFLAFLPLTALFQKLDALEAFQHIAPGSNRACPF